MNSFWNNESIFMFILNCDLHFSIRSDPRNNFLFSALFKSSYKLTGEMMSQRHVVLCLVSSIANHKSLITSSNIFFLSINMNSLSYLAWLLINSNYNCSCFVVHSDINWVITHFFDGLPDYLLNIRFSLSAYLSKNHAHWIFNSCLACNHWIRILGKASIKDRVRDIVTEFIRMSTCDTLWCEEKVTFFWSKMLFLHDIVDFTILFVLN